VELGRAMSDWRPSGSVSRYVKEGRGELGRSPEVHRPSVHNVQLPIKVRTDMRHRGGFHRPARRTPPPARQQSDRLQAPSRYHQPARSGCSAPRGRRDGPVRRTDRSQACRRARSWETSCRWFRRGSSRARSIASRWRRTKPRSRSLIFRTLPNSWRKGNELPEVRCLLASRGSPGPIPRAPAPVGF
jgi:hypothetical protein